MMKTLFLLMVCLTVMLVPARTTTSPDHNGDHHETLCGLLGAAVQKWKTTNHPAVKKALGQAIFGRPEGGDLDNFGLPQEYKTPGNRKYWCGKCEGDIHNYPGKSIPHDLLCLCTVGENGHPFRDHGSVSKLCGKVENELNDRGNSQNHGWSSTNTGVEHLKASWDKLVKPCLKGGEIKLESAIKNLSKSLHNRDTPNWGTSHMGDCGGGNHKENICVEYSTWCLYKPEEFPLWWKQFAWAITTPNLTEAQLNSTTFLNASLDMDHNPDGAHGGHGVGTSATSSSQQAGSTTHHPEEPSNRLLSLFSKHDSTPLTPPFLWSLGALASWF